MVDIYRVHNSYLLLSFISTATATTSTTVLSEREVVQARRVYALSTLLGGVTVLYKGYADIIASSHVRLSTATTITTTTTTGTATTATTGTATSDLGDEKKAQCSTVEGSVVVEDFVYVLSVEGSPRRCGGLGDILSGITATAMHWALQVRLHVHVMYDQFYFII